MTLALALLAIPLIAAFGGLLLAAIDPPDAPPPRVTDRTPSNRPAMGLHPPVGKEQRLQAAPHRGRLIAWSGSIWRAR